MNQKRVEELVKELHDREAYCTMVEEKQGAIERLKQGTVTRMKLAAIEELMDAVQYDAGSENVGEMAYTICGVIRRFKGGEA